MSDLHNGTQFLRGHKFPLAGAIRAEELHHESRQIVDHKDQGRKQPHQTFDRSRRAERNLLGVAACHGLRRNFTEDQHGEGQDARRDADQFAAEEREGHGRRERGGIEIHDIVADQNDREHLLGVL